MERVRACAKACSLFRVRAYGVSIRVRARAKEIARERKGGTETQDERVKFFFCRFFLFIFYLFFCDEPERGRIGFNIREER